MEKLLLREDQDEQESPNLLIVDDEPMNVFVVQQLLKQEGVKADSAYCGNEGVQLVKNRVKEVIKGEAQMYKIIFLDYSMPDLDGP